MIDFASSTTAIDDLILPWAGDLSKEMPVQAERVSKRDAVGTENLAVERPFRLETLGRVKLQGSALSPHKLLVLSYVVLTDRAQDRKHLAELFWRKAANG